MTRQEKWLQYHRIDSDGVIERICNSCDTWKEECLDNFYLQNKSYPERGFNSLCKGCYYIQSTKWRIENRDKARLATKKHDKLPKRKKYAKEKSERYRENGGRKKWEDENKDKILGYSKDRWFNKRHDISTSDWLRCKLYFDNGCAYCGFHIDNHYRKYAGKQQKIDFHKDHVDHNGNDTIDNCVPSCLTCNTRKHNRELDDWFSSNENEKFDLVRLHRIQKWLEEDWKTK